MTDHAAPAKSPAFIPQALGLVALFAIAMAVVAIPLRTITQSELVQQADPEILAQLLTGKDLSPPTQEDVGTFHGQTAQAPTVASLVQLSSVLGVTMPSGANTNKRIEVDLTNQKVYAFENDSKVYEFTISSGKWGWTPTGEFAIWSKVKSQTMKGGDRAKGTYYYLPNVPWIMFFYNDKVPKMRGYSFHGTYWHSNFGTPMSHGCINMKSDEAKVLYDWTTPVVTNPKAWSTLAKAENPGTRVTIYGKAPSN